MKNRFGLLMKFVVLFFCFMLLLTKTVQIYTNSNNLQFVYDRYQKYAVSIGNLAASIVPAEVVLHYREVPVVDAEYEKYLKELRKIQEQTEVAFLYVIYPIPDSREGIYIFDTALEEEYIEENAHSLGEIVDLRKEGVGGAKKVMETGDASIQFEYDGGTSEEWNYLASVYVPIKDSDGNAIAFVGVDMDINLMLDAFERSKGHMVAPIILMVICFGILTLLVEITILKPIRRLKYYVEQISEGKFGEALPIRGHDEISEITEVVNRMSYRIQRHMEEIQLINYAYQKQVPLELLQILNKEDITQLKPGQAVSRFVTVLAFQIVGAKKKMMNQNSKEILEDMNAMFQLTIPEVMKQNGFVKQFQDAGMLAIYTEQTEDAIRSAITICQKMKQFKNWNEETPPEISIGITYGGVLFGTVGHEKRMAAVSISAHTSLAQYLQQLAPKYGSRLLIASGAADRMNNFLNTYHCRFIGMVENKYSRVVEKIYDIYDGDIEEQREGKERTKELFEKGVELFCMRQFRESRLAFIEVLKRFRTDTGAKHYLQCCNRYYQMKETDNISIFM